MYTVYARHSSFTAVTWHHHVATRSLLTLSNSLHRKHFARNQLKFTNDFSLLQKEKVHSLSIHTLNSERIRTFFFQLSFFPPKSMLCLTIFSFTIFKLEVVRLQNLKVFSVLVQMMFKTQNNITDNYPLPHYKSFEMIYSIKQVSVFCFTSEITLEFQ